LQLYFSLLLLYGLELDPQPNEDEWWLNKPKTIYLLESGFYSKSSMGHSRLDSGHSSVLIFTQLYLSIRCSILFLIFFSYFVPHFS